MITHSERFLRQRKLLMVLPVLALPFITLAFWALGGGQGNGTIHPRKQQEGFNASLPNARLKGSNLDKMSLYNQVMQDSMALWQARSMDPYADSFRGESVIRPERYGLTEEMGNNDLSKGYSRVSGNYSQESFPDSNEAKVRAKLAALESTLNSPPEYKSEADGVLGGQDTAGDSSASIDISRLKQMMNNMEAGSARDEDPEMQQLNGMLDKILDIQHPQRLQDKLQKVSLKERGQVFPVTGSSENKEVSLLQQSKAVISSDSSILPSRVFSSPDNAFYDLEEKKSKNNRDQAIAAVVHETETVVSGGTIKMRLLQAIYVNGTLIPKDNFIYGTATLAGERLKIEVTGIRYGNSIFPVSLSVYDSDGMEGIHVPDAITRDAAKQGAGQAVQSLQLMSMDPSLTAQAAGAGMEAVKGLLSKKSKLIRVTIKAGYPVLLVDQKDKR